MKHHFSLPLLALSKKERLVLSALKEGFSTPLLIHEKTSISRTAIYHILTILKERGLIKKYKEAGKFYFKVATPKELADILYETKKELFAFVDGREEVTQTSESFVVIHRGVEALKACYHDMFTKNKQARFIGVQGKQAYEIYREKIGVETLNQANSLIKQNKIIVEGVFAEGSLEQMLFVFGKKWAIDYGGRMANIHTIDPKYFNHSGEIFIFGDTVYLLSVKDLLIIEIRHSDMATVITKLITYIMDTTRTLDVNRRLRELMGKIQEE